MSLMEQLVIEYSQDGNNSSTPSFICLFVYKHVVIVNFISVYYMLFIWIIVVYL